MKTRNITLCALFVSLFYAAGLLKIHVFSVPYTLQTMAVMLAACFLGVKKSLFAIFAYIAMGLAGIPVFTKGGGLGYVLEPSFGYVIGFIPAAVFIGALKGRTGGSYPFTAALLIFSGVLLLLCGALYSYILLTLTSGIKDMQAFISGYFTAFVPAEAVKAAAAAAIYMRLKGYIKAE